MESRLFNLLLNKQKALCDIESSQFQLSIIPATSFYRAFNYILTCSVVSIDLTIISNINNCSKNFGLVIAPTFQVSSYLMIQSIILSICNFLFLRKIDFPESL